jgi:hypothetical protein
MRTVVRRPLVAALGMCVLFGPALAPAADSPRPELPRAEPARKDAAPADEAAQEDLAAMQGTWTYDFTNSAGAVFRVEKVVVDGRDTVAHYDQQGNLIHSHVSTFELKRHGPFRVFTILGTAVTAGPNTGEKRPAPRSFTYRIDGDKMIEAWGLLETDRGPPRVIVWKRVRK